MTAAVRLPIGDIRTVEVAWAALRRLFAEACTVAKADGSPVPEAGQQRALALAQIIEPGSFFSLHDDLVTRHRMELEALHGFIVSDQGRLGFMHQRSRARQGRTARDLPARLTAHRHAPASPITCRQCPGQPHAAWRHAGQPG
jgi:hypothetical protein